jgi:hypothetical protein
LLSLVSSHVNDTLLALIFLRMCLGNLPSFAFFAILIPPLPDAAVLWLVLELHPVKRK